MTSEQDQPNPPPLTDEEKAQSLRLAAESFEGAKERWAKRVKTGLTDEQLGDALKAEFGSFGGSSRDTVGVTFQGDGLRLWADRCIGSRSNPPMLEGRKTIAFARRVYGIADPTDTQGRLF